MVCSSSRIRSGDASARAWPSRPAGSTIWGAVIVMTPFESAVRGSLEGSHGDRFHAEQLHAVGHGPGHRVTPLYGALLQRLAIDKMSVSAVAKSLGVGWDLTNGLALSAVSDLVYDQPGHLADVRYLGVDEHK